MRFNIALKKDPQKSMLQNSSYAEHQRDFLNEGGSYPAISFCVNWNKQLIKPT